MTTGQLAAIDQVEQDTLRQHSRCDTMNFRDHWTTDTEGKRILFTVEMQRALHEHNLPLKLESLENLPANHPLRSNATPTRATSSTPPPDRAGRRSEEPRREARDEKRRPPREPRAESDEPETMQLDPVTGKFIGRLKFYNPTKGYGFIARGSGQTIFVHRTQIIGDPTEYPKGMWVLYDAVETARGLEAFDVEPYDRA